VVIESGGKTVARVPVAPESIAAVQAALDRVETKFAGAVAGGSQGLAVRLFAALIGVLGYFLGPAVVLFQVVVAVLGSSPRAAAALAAATTTLFVYVVSARPQDLSANAIMAILALVMWVLAFRWRRGVKDDGARARLEIAALAVWAVAALIPFFIVGPSVLRVAQVAAGPPAAVAAALSVGAWLWFSGERRPRTTEIAVLALLLVGIGMALIGTTSFVDAFSRDPLLTTRNGMESQRFRETSIELTEVSSLMNVPPGELRVSPNARAFAIVEPCEDEDESVCPRRNVAIGDTVSIQRQFEAMDVQFIDDERIVVLAATDTGATLRDEHVSGQAGEWAVALDDEDFTTLIVDPASRQWIAVAERADERIVFRGRVGEAQVARTALADDVEIADGDQRYIDWKVAGMAEPVGTASRFTFYDDPFFSELRRAIVPQALRFAEDTAVVVPGGPTPRVLADSELDLRCFDAASGTSGVVCVADDTWRTHVWRIDPASGVTAVGWFDGTPWVHSPPAGDRWLLSSGRCTWRVLEVAAHTVATLRFPSDDCPSAAVLSLSSHLLLRTAQGVRLLQGQTATPQATLR
jgi:hypothetical protein